MVNSNRKLYVEVVVTHRAEEGEESPFGRQ